MPGFEPGHRFRDGCLSRTLRYHYSTSAWRRTQDSNPQVVSDQLFSRQLPHQPGTYGIYGIFWCVPRDSNPHSQKRTAPSRQRVYQISTRDAYFVLKLEAGGFKPPCHLPYRSGIASVLPYDLFPKAISQSYLINVI